MMNQIKMKSVLLFILLTVHYASLESLLPEDTMTDSNEELARFKRESFVQSILKHFPFFKHSFDPTENDKDNKADGSDDSYDPEGLSFNPEIDNFRVDSDVKDNEHDSETIQRIKAKDVDRNSSISTSLVTPSVTYIKTKSIQHESVILSEFISESSMHQGIIVSSIVEATPITSAISSIGTSRISISSDNATATSDTQSSLRGYAQSYSSMSERNSSFQTDTFVSGFTTVTSPLQDNNSSSRGMLEPMSSFIETASAVKHEDLSTYSVVQNSYEPDGTTNYSTSESISIAVVLQSVASVSGSSQNILVSMSRSGMTKTNGPGPTQEPTTSSSTEILNQRFRIPVILGGNDDRNVRFLYTNIIIPIISGIMGAMLITFGIMMFRCCRRRRLKKVRYFGGKPSSDLVRLDRMNLLSESSDDEYYD